MSQRGVYSESKMLWWLHRERELPAAPKQVHWVLSDLCNQDCAFCTYRVSGNPSNELFATGSKLSAYGHDNPVRWVDTYRALRLVGELRDAGVLAIQFTGGGEPTVHPQHEDIFLAALEAGLQCALVSNGHRWRERIFDALPSFHWVRVSVDAGTAETYAAIRRVPVETFRRVLGNIERLAGLVDRKKTALGMGYTVTPDNWSEIPLGIRLAKESGAHNIRISAMFGPENERPFLPIYEDIKQLISGARAAFEDDTFTVYDNFGSRLSDLVQHEPDYSFCPYQYYTSYIGGDLHVYRCCVLSYSRRGMVAGGDLTDQTFGDYWRGEQRRRDMETFDARGCPRCMFNGKNREWLYVSGSTYDGPASHVEFP